MSRNLLQLEEVCVPNFFPPVLGKITHLRPEIDPKWPGTLVDRIDDMTRTYTNRVALTDGNGESLTYNQMAQSVDSVASMILKQCADPTAQRIGIFQAPGSEWICTLLAMLRVGASCVPLDLQVGKDRLLLMAQSCKPSLILVDADTAPEHGFLINTGAKIIDVSTVNELEIRDQQLVPNTATPEACAIISYTSGSTGMPKGVPLSHFSYKNYVEMWGTRWGFREGKEIVLQQSSLAFDMSISQILICLSYGGTLVIRNNIAGWDTIALSNLMVSEDVTFTFATPTEYLNWIRQQGDVLSTSKWSGAVTGGEPVTMALHQAFRSMENPEIRLIDVYGPTEVTFGCADQLIPLGLTATNRTPETQQNTQLGLCPLPNYAIYILDADMCSSPVGVSGRIGIGGAGVSNGYLDQTQLAAVAFSRDNYASAFMRRHGWVTLHITEDRGRIDSHGRLHLEGRVQESTLVKMGGIRVDLKDIEATILKTMPNEVLQAVVSLRSGQDSSTPYLAAFVVLDKSIGVDVDHLLLELPHRLPLPQYMRPSVVIALDSMPATVSNKVDRTSVDKIPLLDNPKQPRVPGQNNIMGKMVSTVRSLWLDALPQELSQYHRDKFDIDEDSDFFRAGGNSITLLHLQALIAERLDLRISIDQLFAASRLGRMSMLLLERQGSDESQAIDEQIDWDEETAVPSDLTVPSNLGLVENSVPTGLIVLTGSTGFLGKEILRRLIIDDQVTRVYCIACRRPRQQLHPQDPPHMPK
ncbi:hypothetical protein GGR53DRAFT_110639 [Hypoxylon sp. FL1150]|nr:hypothetical protein GGR53DRAFT_110639 [Hypoxylon sp. FL1150]